MRTERACIADADQRVPINGTGNVSTESFATGQDSTVQIHTVSPSGPIILAALIRTQK